MARLVRTAMSGPDRAGDGRELPGTVNPSAEERRECVIRAATLGSAEAQHFDEQRAGASLCFGCLIGRAVELGQQNTHPCHHPLTRRRERTCRLVRRKRWCAQLALQPDSVPPDSLPDGEVPFGRPAEVQLFGERWRSAMSGYPCAPPRPGPTQRSTRCNRDTPIASSMASMFGVALSPGDRATSVITVSAACARTCASSAEPVDELSCNRRAHSAR
jgi:hypothetical protein